MNYPTCDRSQTSETGISTQWSHRRMNYPTCDRNQIPEAVIFLHNGVTGIVTAQISKGLRTLLFFSTTKVMYTEYMRLALSALSLMRGSNQAPDM